MRPIFPSLMIVAALWGTATSAVGAAEPSDAEIRSAAARALVPLEKSTQEYPNHRQCFSCHHQGIPVLALGLARARGFEVDEENIETQLELAVGDLEVGLKDRKEGRSVPGGIDRIGYALWTLGVVAGRKPDATTSAMAESLALEDPDADHWTGAGARPPSEGSPFTATYVGLASLKFNDKPELRDKIAARIERTRGWLEMAEPKDTEDRVFRLRALKLAGAGPDVVRAAAESLRATQRDDGAWPQLNGGEPDPYATGSALVALHQDAGLPTDDPAYRRGLAYLLRAQRPDGTWYVKSRSKPFQTYFESGFPHGPDQFISITASAWATSALLLALPAKP